LIHFYAFAYSGIARNFRQGVHQSVFLPIQPCSAALPSRPYNQKKTSWYEPPVWTAARHWALASV